MISFNILTLFPEIFDALEYGIIGRAIQSGLLSINKIQIRDFSLNKHKKTDDYPYGGGEGMLMTAQPVVDAWESIENPGRTICLTPGGQLFSHEKCIELSNYENITLVCGRYEGMDRRITDLIADEELSIGDYVISGGEFASLVVIDAVSRMVPGVLGNSTGNLRDSHSDGLLEHPQYTRPEEFRGIKVPSIMLSGDHEKIKSYRIAASIVETFKKRPDILIKRGVSESEAKLIEEIFPGFTGDIDKFIV